MSGIIIFYDVVVNVNNCATVSVSRADGSNGAVLVATYIGGGRMDINLPVNYDEAFAEWQKYMRNAAATGQQHQHGDSLPHSH